LLTERSIINFLIWVAGLILGPYLISSVLWQNYTPLYITVTVLGLFFMFNVFRDWLCIAPLVGYFMTGRIPFLPARLGFTDFFVISTIVYYLVTYVALRRQRMMTGPLYFFIPIMIITSIVIYHDPSFALRLAGGGREGGRGPIFVVLGTIAYLCGVSMNSPSPRFFWWTPIICASLGALSNVPFILTTWFPSLAPILYMVSDNINVGAYAASVLDEGGIVRNSGAAGVAALLVVVLLSYYPIFSLWRPNRWWVAVLVLICIPLVIAGGFRSALATFGLMLFVLTACYSTWRATFLIPFAVAGVLFATFLQNSHLIKLPESAQRSLSFLPGDWDPEVAESAKSSNDFRDNIRKVYMREEFWKSPLFGNGLTYDSADFVNYNMLAQHDTLDGYYSTKTFVTGKMFHTGWISLYDAVGLVGGAAFIFFGCSLIWVVGRRVFVRPDRKSPLSPIRVWMLANLVSSFVGFFTVFGDFKTAFPNFCCYAIVWTHVNRLERFGYKRETAHQPVPFDPERANLPVPA